MGSTKIDLVYTWVDNNDKEWQNQRAYYAKNSFVDKEANNDCRFANHDELRYSLRSVEKYANWINHIYIITAGQTPVWLNTENPQISIIDHKEIIPEAALPTFNSNAILHNMVNIPNLSEYFLYSDDDMFFMDEVTPEFFYTKDLKPICRLKTKTESLDESTYKDMQYNTISLLNSHNYKTPHLALHHCTDAYRKSIIQDCKKEFNAEIEETIQRKFRSSMDIERVIYTYYAIATKQGVMKVPHKVDRWLPLYKRIINTITKNYAIDSRYYADKTEDIEATIKLLKPKLICINDTEANTNESLKYSKIFLEKFFSKKSRFEK